MQLGANYTEVDVRSNAVLGGINGCESQLTTTEGYTTLGESLKNFQNIYNERSGVDLRDNATTNIYVKYKTYETTGHYNDVVGREK